MLMAGWPTSDRMQAPGRYVTFHGCYFARHDLVEDVVRAFQSLLRDDTSLLQQIYKIYKIRSISITYKCLFFNYFIN